MMIACIIQIFWWEFISNKLIARTTLLGQQYFAAENSENQQKVDNNNYGYTMTAHTSASEEISVVKNS